MSLLIDALCLTSVLGIYPRFVEPKLLSVSDLQVTVPSSSLDGFKIIHISDLHFHKKTSSRFLARIVKKVMQQKGDMIVFTGDFICYSTLEDEVRLLDFLSALRADCGCYCILGNHDYERYVSRNRAGDYECQAAINPIKGALLGLRTLFSPPANSKEISPFAKSTKHHSKLLSLIEKSGFKLLDNATHTLPLGLNVVGLGDYSLGQFLPHSAYKDYNHAFPGIVLSHNPDTVPQLLQFPGDLILSGHSHGEQIHFPAPKFLRKLSQKLTRLEYPHLARGRKTLGTKTLYVNRGLGCHKAIRFCSIPEITAITLKGGA